MSKELIESHRQRLEQLKDLRSPYDADYQELSQFLLFRRGVFAGDTQGSRARRRSKSLDSRPVKALKNLAALMQGGLTSPARPWFGLATRDKDLNEWGPVKRWLDYVKDVMYMAYSRSNFYDSIHTLYEELIGFGSGAMFEQPDATQLLRFYPATVGSYWLASSDRNAVDTVYRIFTQSLRQVATRFGAERLSPQHQDILQKRPYTNIDLVHVVGPRDAWDSRSKNVTNLPFYDLYFEKDCDHNLLQESGHNEQPWLVTRWDVSGTDTYGYGPGHDVLADVKQLTAVRRDLTAAISKELNPPMQTPTGMNQRLNMLPGASNPRPRAGDKIEPLFQIQPRIRESVELQQDIRQAILEGFFNDLLIFILNKPNVTATEIAERQEEKLLLLGPVIERQQSELLDPITDRTFGILNRLGLIPPAPQELQGMELKVEYISLLAQAQKLVGTQAVDQVVQSALGAAQFDPSVLDKINLDEFIDIKADLLGTRGKLVRTDEEVQIIRQNRAKERAAANAMVAAQQGAQTAKTLSDTPMGESNALDAVMGGGVMSPQQQR